MMRSVAFLSVALLAALSATAIAEPLETPVVGPMQVCLEYSVFSLDDGERITDSGSSMHSVALEVEGANGSYSVVESDIFATPSLGRLLADRDGTRVYRVRGRAIEYAILGATTFSDGKERTVIRLKGAALNGTARDAKIYQRFRIREPYGCAQAFRSGIIVDH